MKPALAKAHADVVLARKRLAAVLKAEDDAVVPLVGCRLCKAPKGTPCCKGTWPHGVRTRCHTERRKDADQC
jgi:hypothetical protein